MARRHYKVRGRIDDATGTGVLGHNAAISGTGAAGDLVYAVNDGGSIKTQIVAPRSDAT